MCDHNNTFIATIVINDEDYNKIRHAVTWLKDAPDGMMDAIRSELFFVFAATEIRRMLVAVPELNNLYLEYESVGIPRLLQFGFVAQVFKDIRSSDELPEQNVLIIPASQV